MRLRRFSLLVVMGGILALTMPPAYGDELHARVSYESGGAMVRGTSDADWSYAPVNTLVLTGDTLWADTGALLEVEMSGGTFVRLADRSKAEVVSLPPAGVVRGWAGSFYVQRISRSTGNFTFNTPASNVAVERDTQVRLDVLESGATTVTVRWGRVTLRTDLGSPVVVNAGQRSFIDPGYLPSLPERFDSGEQDDFDVWNRERARVIALGDKAFPSDYRTRPKSVPLGVYDLPNHGEWVYVDNDYYWRPTVVVNYIPYRSGHWSYVPVYGYCWVGDYPFSYVTSHYGRWTYNSSYGWLWTYRETWSPAWVAAVRVGPNFVWCPLDVYDRPVSYGTMTWDFGTVRFSITASSYCPADTLLFGSSYPFVYPVNSNVVNVVNGNVYIWNFYGDNYRTDRPGRPSSVYSWAEALQHSGIPMRDYSPRRVIRGPDSIGPQATRAAERINRLESAVGRTDFAAVDRTGARQVRTSATGDGRASRMRDVTVAEARQQEGVTTTQRAVRAQRESEENPRASRDTRSLASTDAGTGGNPAPDRSGGRSRREAGGGATGEPRSSAGEAGLATITRPTRETRTDQSGLVDGTDPGNRSERTNRSVDASRPPSRTLSSSEGRSGLRNVESPERGPARVTDTSVDRTPSRNLSREVAEGARTPSRTQEGLSGRTPSRVIERNEPSPLRSTPDSSERVPSTIQRRDNGAPRSVAPRGEPRSNEAPVRTSPRSSGRTVTLGGPAGEMAGVAPNRAMNGYTPTQQRSMTSTPRTEAQTQTPGVSARVPQTPRSAVVAPPSNNRQMSPPSGGYEMPSRGFDVPQRGLQAPQRVYEAPQRRMQAPEPVYEAPQPRMQAPQVERIMPRSEGIELPRQNPMPSGGILQRQGEPRIEMAPQSSPRGMGGVELGGGRGLSGRAVGGRER